jgi:hypothetical protein
VSDAFERLNMQALSDDRPLLELSKETMVGVTGTPARIVHVAMRRDLARIARKALRGETP